MDKGYNVSNKRLSRVILRRKPIIIKFERKKEEVSGVTSLGKSSVRVSYWPFKVAKVAISRLSFEIEVQEFTPLWHCNTYLTVQNTEGFWKLCFNKFETSLDIRIIRNFIVIRQESNNSTVVKWTHNYSRISSRKLFH